ncbi:dihydroxyacetone kinase operon transcriptional regulator DhaR, partial [Photobacterium sp. OFAV2-7]|uniref:dihydroxyacetone kinase operon transcriptional regulator DhaR n=1 Tax=Photobacterium sp. OFAV2-7 TaxID=2917748 RepID=UPI001EF74A93
MLDSTVEDTLNRWKFFQKHHWVAPEFVLSPILNSWERCRRQSSPYTWSKPPIASGSTLNSLLNRTKDISTIAETALEDTIRAIEPKECCLLVTDDTGCTLSLISTPSIMESLEQLGFKKGAFWSEDRIGTNAVSLSLHINEPICVFAAQHFNQHLHAYSCHAAPIFNAEGKLQATLMLITRVEDHRQEDSALITACAREVSCQLQLEKNLADSNIILSQRDAVLECMDDGLIAWDHNSCITFINNQAADIFKLQKDRVIGTLLHEIIMLPPLIKSGIENQNTLSHIDITFECQGDFIEALVTLRPLNDGSFLFFLHPLETFRKLAQRQLGGNVRLSFDSLTADSVKMKQVLMLAKRAAKSNNPILLRGEEGIGKRQLALAIHDTSKMNSGPFITVNCQAIQPEKMVKELLGTDEGEGQASKFELANGGTLYLEHVEFLCSEVQSALLQILKSNLAMRANSSRMIPVNFQLITCTRADLELYVSQHSFRRQLYYAISPVEINIPPLRERKEDIVALIQKQIKKQEKRYNTTLSISSRS